MLQNISIALLATGVQAAHNIMDYGAVPNKFGDTATAFNNADAIASALQAANQSESDNEVLVPGGQAFEFMPVVLSDLSEITVTIDGELWASKNYLDYPRDKDGEGSVYDMFTLTDIKDMKWQGSGFVDGQGFMWWQREYVQKNPAGRPHLHSIRRGQNIEFTGIKWQNSPRYHMFHMDSDNLYYHDFEIYVDMWGQMSLGKILGNDLEYTVTVPTFALNTDGIDPSATNVLIERVTITNFDDAVAVKPAHNDGQIAKCAENIIVRDCVVNYGVGMTIGSVPPRDTYACIRDVHFSNIKFYHPFKAIYVKTNPGTTTSMEPGSGGEITNISYENIDIHFPIWWNIYIGPQQQKQPGGAGPGCMFYPIGDCETQPLITVADITLRNITSHGGLLPPGIIRANEAHPGTGFVWENVNLHGWWRIFGLGFITENVSGTVTDSHPVPAFTNLVESGEVESYEFNFVQELYNEVYDRVMDIWMNHMPKGHWVQYRNRQEPKQHRRSQYHFSDGSQIVIIRIINQLATFFTL